MEHFSYHGQHIFGTTVQNSASWGVLAPGICAPLHQIILTRQNCWGQILCVELCWPPKENLAMSQDTHLYKLHSPHPQPPPQKKFNRFVGFGVFKKATTKAVFWDVPTFWRNLSPTSSGYSGWGTLNIYQTTRHHIPETSCHIRFIMGCSSQDHYNHRTAACLMHLMLTH
jgi:hypothetical protein